MGINDESLNSEKPPQQDLMDSTKEPINHKSITIKLRWSRVFMIATILSLFVIVVNILAFWLLLNNDLFGNLPLWLLIECGLLLIFGGCLGTTKQSFMINWVKVKLLKGEKITGKDTKIAIGSAYTYIIAGFFVGIASFISWIVLDRFFFV